MSASFLCLCVREPKKQIQICKETTRPTSTVYEWSQATVAPQDDKDKARSALKPRNLFVNSAPCPLWLHLLAACLAGRANKLCQRLAIKARAIDMSSSYLSPPQSCYLPFCIFNLIKPPAEFGSNVTSLCLCNLLKIGL